MKNRELPKNLLDGNLDNVEARTRILRRTFQYGLREIDEIVADYMHKPDNVQEAHEKYVKKVDDPENQEMFEEYQERIGGFLNWKRTKYDKELKTSYTSEILDPSKLTQIKKAVLDVKDEVKEMRFSSAKDVKDKLKYRTESIYRRVYDKYPSKKEEKQFYNLLTEVYSQEKELGRFCEFPKRELKALSKDQVGKILKDCDIEWSMEKFKDLLWGEIKVEKNKSKLQEDALYQNDTEVKNIEDQYNFMTEVLNDYEFDKDKGVETFDKLKSQPFYNDFMEHAKNYLQKNYDGRKMVEKGYTVDELQTGSIQNAVRIFKDYNNTLKEQAKDLRFKKKHKIEGFEDVSRQRKEREKRVHEWNKEHLTTELVKQYHGLVKGFIDEPEITRNIRKRQEQTYYFMMDKYRESRYDFEEKLDHPIGNKQELSDFNKYLHEIKLSYLTEMHKFWDTENEEPNNELLEKQIDIEVDRVKDEFAEKNTDKISIVLHKREDCKDFKTDMQYKSEKTFKREDVDKQVSGDIIEGNIYVSCEKGDKFRVNNQLVFVENKFGTEFTRFPTTFHDVVFDGEKVEGMPSEQWMNESFTNPKKEYGKNGSKRIEK